MLLSTTESDVLSEAKRLGEALETVKADEDEEAFSSLLTQCNEELGDELGVDYGDICSSSDCC